MHESGTYAEMETGATALAFADELDTVTSGEFQHNRVDGNAAGAEVAFIVEHATFAQALANGATFVIAPVEKPWGQTVSYLRDLNGFLVEICTAVRG